MDKYQPERLAQARKLRGLSVHDLAVKTDLTKQSIYLFEKSKTPSADTLLVLAKALNVAPRFLALPVRKSEIVPSVYFFCYG